MKTKYLFRGAIISLSFLLLSCSSDDTSSEPEEKMEIITVYNYSAIELETMTLINNYRKSVGLNELKKINHISYKSEEHDEYMIDNNVVNHDDFDSRADNIIKALGAIKVSENIAYNYDSAQGVFDAWMKSPNHKENIVGDFTDFGIAIRENPINKRKYYTNIFVKL